MFTSAFVYQLGCAGFKTVVLNSPTEVMPEGACAVLSGVLGKLSLSETEHSSLGGILVNGGSQKLRGKASLAATLKRPDGSVLYEGASDNARSFGKGCSGGDAETAKTANEMLSALVDDLCQKPEFVANLQKLATTE